MAGVMDTYLSFAAMPCDPGLSIPQHRLRRQEGWDGQKEGGRVPTVSLLHESVRVFGAAGGSPVPVLEHRHLHWVPRGPPLPPRLSVGGAVFVEGGIVVGAGSSAFFSDFYCHMEHPNSF